MISMHNAAHSTERKRMVQAAHHSKVSFLGISHQSTSIAMHLALICGFANHPCKSLARFLDTVVQAMTSE